MRWTESDLETLFAVLEALSDTNQEKSEKDTCKGAEAVDHDITNRKFDTPKSHKALRALFF